MLKNFWLLALAIPALLIGCGDDPTPDDDDDDAPRFPYLVEVSPSPKDEAGFFYQASLVAEFDVAPTSVTVSLTDFDGNAVAGTQELASNGRVATFDPTDSLVASSGYTMTIEWSPSEEGHSPFVHDFQTSAHGGTVDDPTLMIGNTYSIDLASATFIEPPGIGPILASQIEGFSVLFAPVEEGTDFDAGYMHVMGAIGDVGDDDVVTQDACAPTLAFTNPDGILGNEDDTPAEWMNPEMVLQADSLPLTIQGVTAELQNLVISGTFHPDLSNMRGGVFEGFIDTRPLVGALGSGEDPNEICDLVMSTVQVGCVSCTLDDGDDTDEVFCLSLVAEDLAADQIEGLSLVEKPCEDIISAFVADGSCDSEAAAYDEDADGVYELCPAYVPPAE